LIACDLRSPTSRDEAAGRMVSVDRSNRPWHRGLGSHRSRGGSTSLIVPKFLPVNRHPLCLENALEHSGVATSRPRPSMIWRAFKTCWAFDSAILPGPIHSAGSHRSRGGSTSLIVPKFLPVNRHPLCLENALEISDHRHLGMRLLAGWCLSIGQTGLGTEASMREIGRDHGIPPSRLTAFMPRHEVEGRKKISSRSCRRNSNRVRSPITDISG
jgi:hypothetical protein